LHRDASVCLRDRCVTKVAKKLCSSNYYYYLPRFSASAVRRVPGSPEASRSQRSFVRSSRRSSPSLVGVGKYVVSLLGATESASRAPRVGRQAVLNKRTSFRVIHASAGCPRASLSLSLSPPSPSLSLSLPACAIACVRVRVQLRCARACSHIDRTTRRSRRDRARLAFT